MGAPPVNAPCAPNCTSLPVPRALLDHQRGRWGCVAHVHGWRVRARAIACAARDMYFEQWKTHGGWVLTAVGRR
eukprot:gene11625-biopygen9431